MGILTRIRQRLHNIWVRDPVRLWLDDVRPAPWGWYWALTAAEAWDVLKNNLVVDASLDHDLGQNLTGYDLVLHLAEFREVYGLNIWPLQKPTVHSANPPGKANMQAVINRYGPYGEK